MTENNTKLTKQQLIIGAVVLVIILFFVFSNKPATEQASSLSESNNSAAQAQENAIYKEQLVGQLMGRDRKLPYETEPYIRSMVYNFFDQIIKNGYLIKSDFSKSEKKLTLYLDSNILKDDMAETWLAGLAVQVMGEVKNVDDFILKYGTNENTGEYDSFAVYTVPSGVISQMPNNIRELSPKAVETTIDNGTGRANILDLVIQGKVFAHFENGGVFSELDRLGLMGVISKDGEAIFFRPNLQEQSTKELKTNSEESITPTVDANSLFWKEEAARKKQRDIDRKKCITDIEQSDLGQCNLSPLACMTLRGAGKTRIDEETDRCYFRFPNN